MKYFLLFLLFCFFYTLGGQQVDRPIVLPVIVGEYYPYSDPAENARFEKECYDRFGIDITE